MKGILDDMGIEVEKTTRQTPWTTQTGLVEIMKQDEEEGERSGKGWEEVQGQTIKGEKEQTPAALIQYYMSQDTKDKEKPQTRANSEAKKHMAERYQKTGEGNMELRLKPRFMRQMEEALGGTIGELMISPELRATDRSTTPKEIESCRHKAIVINRLVERMENGGTDSDTVKLTKERAQKRGIMIIQIDTNTPRGASTVEILDIHKTSILDNPLRPQAPPTLMEGETTKLHVAMLYGSQETRDAVKKCITKGKTKRVNNIMDMPSMSQTRHKNKQTMGNVQNKRLSKCGTRKNI